jgi:cytochrome b
VRVRVWDLPVRLFHWLLVALLAFQVVTVRLGGRFTEWHVYGGYAVFVLVAFRLAWGFAGSASARFGSFLARPDEALRFGGRLLRRRAETYAGHNPLGGWMVVALLASLVLQVATGLFANDGIAIEGPLARRLPIEVSDRLTALHGWNFWILAVLATVHTLAAVYHWLVLKEDLIAAMFTGTRELAGARDEAPIIASQWRALAVLACALAALWLVVTV